MTGPERRDEGPIEAATQDLMAWLAQAAGQPARLGPPQDGAADGLSLWPLELRPQRQTRTARLELLKAQAEAHMRLAEIERTLGEPL